MSLVFNNKNEKEEEGRIEKRLALYEARRKQEIDEKLSEYRRSEKNKAVDEVKAHADASLAKSREMFKEQHEAEKAHEVAKVARKAELVSLDDQRAAKVREIAQAQTDFESRGLLRDRAQKAEKEKGDAVLAEKDKHIAHLEKTVETLINTHTSALTEAVKHLGSASNKECVTKVVGFGPSSDSKKV